MLNFKGYIKNILLILVVFFCYSYFSPQLSSLSFTNKTATIDAKLTSIFEKLDTRSFTKQTQFYKTFKSIVAEKKIITKDANKLELFTYIEDAFDNKYSQYKANSLEQKANQLTLNGITSETHNSLILRFSRGGNHSYTININKEKIKNIASVFLFKIGNDLSRTDILYITSELKRLNPNITIFIDQEGGWINRYVEFEKAADVNQYFSNSEIDTKIRSLFVANYGYFPSLKRIGTFYDTFTTDNDKQYFLDKIAYIRLQTLKNNGINTYGLVLDINRGNPVIDGYSRSFSTHLNKYKLLVDAFTKASTKTGVILYFKHFPGHGAGNIDSHKGILNLSGEDAYLDENLELFNYALTQNSQAGIMVAHAYIPNNKLTEFNKGITNARFILTDDLGMQGYTLARGKSNEGLFFTTDNIINNKKLIIVDSINVTGIK